MRITDGARLAHQLHHRFPAAAPVDVLERVAAERRVNISQYPFPDEISGIMCMIDGQPVIGINEFHYPERQLFSLAHEMGHVLLGHRSGLLAGEPAEDDPADEREANAFAAEFLMPAERVALLAAQGMELDGLCRAFGVSREAMTRRLIELGLRRPDADQPRPQPALLPF